VLVRSSDGLDLVVHDLGGIGRPLLLSHATGFHGHCYAPMAHQLADRFHSLALDYRGHGDSPTLLGSDGMPVVDWDRYGDDATAVATALAESRSEPLVGFGHSMGGACLLMAAHRDPSLFSHLVVFEPIVFPTDMGPRPEGPNPLVAGARRRRASFASFEAAIENFAAKPPLRAFTASALEAYVRHGFRRGEDGAVHLKCLPETEARTFESGNGHATWDVLPEIRTPVLVVAGVEEEFQPSARARPIAEALPNGRYLQSDDLDHFGPMTHPDLMARVVAEFVS
jgi:pimeloyl-ACP methyl ester carboxylesterase